MTAATIETAGREPPALPDVLGGVWLFLRELIDEVFTGDLADVAKPALTTGANPSGSWVTFAWPGVWRPHHEIRMNLGDEEELWCYYFEGRRDGYPTTSWNWPLGDPDFFDLLVEDLFNPGHWLSRGDEEERDREREIAREEWEERERDREIFLEYDERAGVGRGRGLSG